jgi:hypothetical protein
MLLFTLFSRFSYIALAHYISRRRDAADPICYISLLSFVQHRYVEVSSRSVSSLLVTSQQITLHFPARKKKRNAKKNNDDKMLQHL